MTWRGKREELHVAGKERTTLLQLTLRTVVPGQQILNTLVINSKKRGVEVYCDHGACKSCDEGFVFVLCFLADFQKSFVPSTSTS